MIELISIHIPKTAGSSLFQTLKKVYGRPSVLKINNLRNQLGDIKLDDLEDYSHTQSRVIHGHVRYPQMGEIIMQNNPKLITWLRDPVDRVISNYFFSMNRIRDGKAKPEKLHTKFFSLIEYAALDVNRNMMSRFLDGSSLGDFHFVGLTEHFQDDMIKLGQSLDWPATFMIPHRKDGSSFRANNDCTTQYGDIDDAMRNEVALLNSEDRELYSDACKLRNKK